MENHLAENIRDARKRAGFTQEQLADRLGITLGTISKWERGASEPDIGYLMELADVFRISVDALIGFSMRGGDADSEAERIENMVGNKPVEQVLEEYKLALRRFPNHFRIVLGAAEIYLQIGTVYKKNEALHESLSLHRHALELFSQNTDPKINEVIIRNSIAMCYSQLKDHKRAVEEYKKNNVCGLNDVDIGQILIADLKQDKEGIGYIESAFLTGTGKMISLLSAYFIYYLHTGDYERGIRAIRWGMDYAKSLKEYPGERGYLDKMLCLYNLALSIAYAATGQTRESDACLDAAIRMAIEFDRDPIYDLHNLILTDHVKKTTVYDDAGATAVEALYAILDKVKDNVSEKFKQKFEAKLAESAAYGV